MEKYLDDKLELTEKLREKIVKLESKYNTSNKNDFEDISLGKSEFSETQ